MLIFLALASMMDACKHESTETLKQIIDTTHYIPPYVNLIDSVCYNEIIEPILISNCGKNGCHNDAHKEKGISVSSYTSVKKTLSGPLLLQSIQDSGQLGMPQDPYPKLNSTQISLIKQWVKEGMKLNVDCEGPCDTLNVKYSTTILPILQNSCLGCHTTTRPQLVVFDSVKYQVNNGKLLCSVMQNTGCVAMPQNAPKLSNCKLNQIKKWISLGALNN